LLLVVIQSCSFGPGIKNYLELLSVLSFLKWQKIIRAVLSTIFASIFWIAITSQCHAATDDMAFDECRALLNQDSDVMPGQVWYKPPIDAATEKALTPDLRKYLGTIVRWTYLVNADNSRTVVLMTRDLSEPQLEDDPDAFYVFMEKKGISVSHGAVVANAFAFSAYEMDNVNAFFFCTYDRISPEWDWDGQDWSP
jgi:hypothetical protein